MSTTVYRCLGCDSEVPGDAPFGPCPRCPAPAITQAGSKPSDAEAIAREIAITLDAATYSEPGQFRATAARLIAGALEARRPLMRRELGASPEALAAAHEEFCGCGKSHHHLRGHALARCLRVAALLERYAAALREHTSP